MVVDGENLLPCPFCGAGETLVEESHLPPRMDGRRGALISATVRHWCERVDGDGIVGGSIQFRGRTREDAVAAWNRRSRQLPAEPKPESDNRAALAQFSGIGMLLPSGEFFYEAPETSVELTRPVSLDEAKKAGG